MKKISQKKKKIFSILLYLLPIIFFFSSYFLMVVSGEDVHQGANRTPNPIVNAVNSFKWSARTSDVYQHVAIKFYTYTSFEGSFSNFICRAFDVFLAALLIYLAMRYVLRRRPKLEIKDAFLANVFFIILIYSVHAKVLYRGFSLINNYLFIGVATLLFCLPFINEIYRKRKANWLFSAWMLIAGILFGISHNITPLAFLLTYVLYFIYLRFCEKQTHVIKAAFSWWKITALVGLIAGVLFCYIVGPGVSGYSDGNYAAMYDYVGFSNIIHSPIKSVAKITGHMISNFKNIMSPLYLPIIVCAAFVLYVQKKRRIKYDKWTTTEKRVIVSLSLFMFAYWLAMFQIKNLTRLYFPANITGIIILLYVFYHYFKSFNYAKIGKTITIFSIVVMVGLSVFAICCRTYIAIDYYRQVKPQLEMIKTSPKAEVCVNEKENRERSYPIANFTQEPIFEDWTMPAKMYGKTVTFCKK